MESIVNATVPLHKVSPPGHLSFLFSDLTLLHPLGTCHLVYFVHSFRPFLYTGGRPGELPREVSSRLPPVYGLPLVLLFRIGHRENGRSPPPSSSTRQEKYLG